jgi:transposase-like protein
MDTMSRINHRKPARGVRQRFSEEFKEQTVRWVLDEGKTVNAVGRKLDFMPLAVEL